MRLALALLCTLLLVATGLLESVHQATVEHSVCAEHGELVHPDAPAEDGDAGDVHEHCKLCVGAEGAATLVAGPGEDLDLLPASLAWAPTSSADAGRAFATWRMAPKTSPPLAA